LADHREQDDNEDKAVDALRPIDTLQYGERRQEDRYGSFQPAPGHKSPFGRGEARTSNGDDDGGRSSDNGEHEHQHDTLEPRPPAEGAQCHCQAEGDEDGYLREAGERTGEARDDGFVPRPATADDEPSKEDGEKA
jgi:hypothetical protein